MINFLYSIIYAISGVHSRIIAWNNTRAVPFTDKELHFIVIGLLGIAMILVVYPIFKWLANRGHEMIIAWIYVFTLIIVITFAIEIGQGYTGTGRMEFDDIMFGVVGFIVMFAVFAIIRWIFNFFVGWIFRFFKKKKK